MLLNPSLEPNDSGGGWLLKDDTVTLARPATNLPLLLGDPGLTGSLSARNSLEHPDRIAPLAGEVAISGQTPRFSVPPLSACALGVK